MAPHSSTLAWKTPWTEEPGGLRSMASLRVSSIYWVFATSRHTVPRALQVLTHLILPRIQWVSIITIPTEKITSTIKAESSLDKAENKPELRKKRVKDVCLSKKRGRRGETGAGARKGFRSEGFWFKMEVLWTLWSADELKWQNPGLPNGKNIQGHWEESGLERTGARSRASREEAGRTSGRDWSGYQAGSQAERGPRATPGHRPSGVPGPRGADLHAGTTRTGPRHGKSWEGWDVPQAGLRPRLPSAATRGRGAQPWSGTDWRGFQRVRCVPATHGRGGGQGSGCSGLHSSLRGHSLPPPLPPAPCSLPNPKRSDNTGQAITLQSFQKQSESEREKLFKEQWRW